MKPSALISQNEIDAANSVRFEVLNAQGQPELVWPASFAAVRSYLDQLERNAGLPRDRASGVAGDLASAERASGPERRTALTSLATQLDRDAESAPDAPRVRAMASAVRDLADVTR